MNGVVTQFESVSNCALESVSKLVSDSVPEFEVLLLVESASNASKRIESRSVQISEKVSEFVSELLVSFLLDSMSEVWILPVSEFVSEMDWSLNSLSCPPNSGDDVCFSVAISSAFSNDLLRKVFN